MTTRDRGRSYFLSNNQRRTPLADSRIGCWPFWPSFWSLLRFPRPSPNRMSASRPLRSGAPMAPTWAFQPRWALPTGANPIHW